MIPAKGLPAAIFLPGWVKEKMHEKERKLQNQGVLASDVGIRGGILHEEF